MWSFLTGLPQLIPNPNATRKGHLPAYSCDESGPTFNNLLETHQFPSFTNLKTKIEANAIASRCLSLSLSPQSRYLSILLIYKKRPTASCRPRQTWGWVVLIRYCRVISGNIWLNKKNHTAHVKTLHLSIMVCVHSLLFFHIFIHENENLN